jgi:hypothetical protein
MLIRAIPVIVLLITAVLASGAEGGFEAPPLRPAGGGEIVVLVEGDFEIPPLAYYDGREYKPIHVAYVADWEKAYWVEGNITVDIPTWTFKKAIIHIPKEALWARAPPNAKGGMLRIHINRTVVELVEAPPGVVATYSYLKPGAERTERNAIKARAEWVKPPARRGPLDKDIEQEKEEQIEQEQTEPRDGRKEASQLSSWASRVHPSGAFIYQQYRGEIRANRELCLNVLIPPYYTEYAPRNNPTVASVGYNATHIWRTAWYVYTSSYNTGQVVGRGIIKVWRIHPITANKLSLLGQWYVDLRNGYVTFTFPISLRWPNEFIGVELCFKPDYNAVYVVGANATIGFVKNAIPAASGVYFLGINPIDRLPGVGGVVAYRILRPPVRNLVFGPFSIVDGYYGQRLNLDMTVYVPWGSSRCPSLTVTTYIGDRGHMQIDSAVFPAVRYFAGECIYDVRRSVVLSNTIGIWYDEARAGDRAVVLRVSFSHSASEVVIYRADISGQRFAENYIDKNDGVWNNLVLRGFFSQTLRTCGSPALPEVNNTVVLVNIETYSLASGVAADFIAVTRGAPRNNVVDSVTFRIRPATAFKDAFTVYAKGDQFEEPWFITWLFRIAQAVKSALDFFEKIPGPISWFIDTVLDLRGLLYPDYTVRRTSEYVEISWRAGLGDKFYQVAFEVKVSPINRTIEVVDVKIRGINGCMYTPVVSQMPRAVAGDPTFTQLRHWVYGMRVTSSVIFNR